MRRPALAALASVCALALSASAATGGVPPVRYIGSPRVAAHAKRGVASSQYLVSNPSKLVHLGASWAYDWSAAAPPTTASLMWVPMIARADSINPQVIAQLRAARRSGRARYLLGFNEPDSTAQSNLTPDQAASLWPQLEQTGLILGSPATATTADGWLASFMALARQRHLRVNFIALHYYQDFTNPSAVSELRQQLVAIHDQYRKPIWITEIGAIDIRGWGEPMLGVPTDALAAHYMRHLFTMLDALAFVRRYAWFTDDCWNDVACRSGSLYTGAGDPTPAGRTFRTAA